MIKLIGGPCETIILLMMPTVLMLCAGCGCNGAGGGCRRGASMIFGQCKLVHCASDEHVVPAGGPAVVAAFGT